MKWLKKLFCNHPNQQGETYWQHGAFALSVATHFIFSAVFLFVHAILPFICPPKPFDLQSTLDYIKNKCDYRNK